MSHACQNDTQHAINFSRPNLLGLGSFACFIFLFGKKFERDYLGNPEMIKLLVLFNSWVQFSHFCFHLAVKKKPNSVGTSDFQFLSACMLPKPFQNQVLHIFISKSRMNKLLIAFCEFSSNILVHFAAFGYRTYRLFLMSLWFINKLLIVLRIYRLCDITQIKDIFCL